jgi:hypothetical protein
MHFLPHLGAVDGVHVLSFCDGFNNHHIAMPSGGGIHAINKAGQ